MENMLQKITEACAYLESHLPFKPEVGLILGSGLGILADEIENPVYVAYADIPHFPVSTVEGHQGRFVIGQLAGRRVMAMQGRFHYYEGYGMKEVTFPVRVMKAIGITHVLLTNAAGGVNLNYVPGDLMLITDQLNMAALNPLLGANFEELGPRFPDASEIYDKAINGKVLEIAKSMNIDLKSGVYQMNPGPAYETPAEVRMARILGADAVGMSTVPEALVARHGGMKVTGISCITNMAAGILPQPLHHAEVVETANRVKNTFVSLVKAILPALI